MPNQPGDDAKMSVDHAPSDGSVPAEDSAPRLRRILGVLHDVKARVDQAVAEIERELGWTE